MGAVARAAGVSKGLLHYHFRSKEHLLVETQRATFRQIHRRFEDRFERGERGLSTALEGLDALWESVYEMRGWTPFIVQTMALAGQERPIRRHVDDFYGETMALLERGLRNVFEGESERLAMPPERLAMLIRTTLHGLIVELALARSPSQLERVDRAYRDLREVFSRIALTGPLDPEESP